MLKRRRSRNVFSIARRSVRSTFTLGMKKLLILAAISAAMSVSALAALDTKKIDEITGLKGKLNEKEGVYKVTFPREDVKMVVDGWTMPPFMGLATGPGLPAEMKRAWLMADTVLSKE